MKKIVLKSVKAIRKLRSMPRRATGKHAGYCVLGAWCLENDGPHRFPWADMFANAVYGALGIEPKGAKYFDLQDAARQVCRANDAGRFDKAWELLEKLEAKFLRNRENVVLVDE